jgi:hypothetical protein
MYALKPNHKRHKMHTEIQNPKPKIQNSKILIYETINFVYTNHSLHLDPFDTGWKR